MYLRRVPDARRSRETERPPPMRAGAYQTSSGSTGSSGVAVSTSTRTIIALELFRTSQADATPPQKHHARHGTQKTDHDHR